MPLNPRSLGLAIASLFSVLHSSADDFASEVTTYEPGTGFAIEFGSGLGYTNALSVLGAPSRVTPGQFGGPVDPFNPPYLREQIVSLGAGGSLTVEFARPIQNHPANPFGIDFLIFGSAGFVITNGDFSGGGITDGSLFGASTGATRVSVSQDNQTFFTLNPSLAPIVDGLFPTDGDGNFSQPVNPDIRASEFANQSLAGIRARYQNSAGGAGYDLTWAVDASGQPVPMASARFVRIEALSGHSEIDGLSVVAAATSTWSEDFSEDPRSRGWGVHGDEALFRWDTDRQRLGITWDSSRTNSYFHRSLDTVLDRNDDFRVDFSLELESIQIGVDPNKPQTFEMSIGLFRLADATRTDFFRGSGINGVNGARNLVEFSYFPDSGFGATVSPTIVSSNNQFATSFNFPLELTTNDRFHVALTYSASAQTLATTLTRNGVLHASILEVRLDRTFTDFRVDTLAIASYSDAGQSPPQFAGSLLARGWIDNITVTTPSPPLRDLAIRRAESSWQMEFRGTPGWIYRVERSEILGAWRDIGVATFETGDRFVFLDTEPERTNAFYRIRMERP